jgi:hypothetical protein
MLVTCPIEGLRDPEKALALVGNNPSTDGNSDNLVSAIAFYRQGNLSQAARQLADVSDEPRDVFAVEFNLWKSVVLAANGQTVEAAEAVERATMFLPLLRLSMVDNKNAYLPLREANRLGLIDEQYSIAQFVGGLETVPPTVK